MITCANQKGGVGKTCTAVHLATGLCLSGKKTRLLDLDTQRNSILCLSKDCRRVPDEELDEPITEGWEIYRSLEGVEVLAPAVLAPEQPPTLSGLERAIAWGGDLSHVIIDCPPSLEGWTAAALEICDHILVPLQCEFLAMQGLASVLASIPKDRSGRNKAKLHILPVMQEPDKNIHQEILAEVRKHLPTESCVTWIPRDPALSEASSFGLSLFAFRSRAVGARAYAKLVREVIDGWT